MPEPACAAVTIQVLAVAEVRCRGRSFTGFLTLQHHLNIFAVRLTLAIRHGISIDVHRHLNARLLR